MFARVAQVARPIRLAAMPLIAFLAWGALGGDPLPPHGVAMVVVPRALRHAFAEWRYRACRSTLSAPDAGAEECAWKVLFALDLLLFDDLKDTGKEASRRCTVAARMELMEGG